MDLHLLPYLPERDVYRLLGVPPSADRAAIVGACRRLSRTFHPDRNGSPSANEEMRVVNAVRSLLTDAAARAEYDRARLRFLAAGTRVASPAPRRPAVRQIDRSRRPADLARNARSAMAGLLAGLAARAPLRPVVRQLDGARRSADLVGDLARAARAVMAGLLAGLAALAPPRCPSCHALVEREYRYCGACGGPLLSEGAQPPA